MCKWLNKTCLISDNPWSLLLEETQFWESIDKHGYYQSPYLSFEVYKNKYNLTLKNRAPAYLSIDFWSDQASALTKKRLYVLRTGRGRFVIFSLDRFAKPYLDLSVSNAMPIKAKDVDGFDHLTRSFKDHYQEDTNLELLRMMGIYDELVNQVCGRSSFLIGPRGHRYSSFKLHMIDKEQAEPVPFNYDGQEELDYTIWTEDSVFVFEAKQLQSTSRGLDIGWHKLVFPTYRFVGLKGLNIFPVYYLRRNHAAYLFVFDKLHFYNDGLVLNDIANHVPKHVFRVDLA